MLFRSRIRLKQRRHKGAKALPQDICREKMFQGTKVRRPNLKSTSTIPDPACHCNLLAPLTRHPRQKCPRVMSHWIPGRLRQVPATRTMTGTRHREETSPRPTTLPTLMRTFRSFLKPSEQLRRLNHLRHSSLARAKDSDASPNLERQFRTLILTPSRRSHRQQKRPQRFRSRNRRTAVLQRLFLKPWLKVYNPS